MNILKYILPGIATLLITCSALAEHVPYNKAYAVAQNFFSAKNGKVEPVPANTLPGTKSGLLTPYYIFNNQDKGFVIISGNDLTEPILAYSYENNFDGNNVPTPLISWLDALSQTITSLDNKKTQNKKIKSSWDKALVKTKAYSPIEPVIQLETAHMITTGIICHSVQRIIKHKNRSTPSQSL